MKRILKLKSHPYEVYNISYKVIFCNCQPNSVKKPLKQSQNIRETTLSRVCTSVMKKALSSKKVVQMLMFAL